jgi:hypothetical protein
MKNERLTTSKMLKNVKVDHLAKVNYSVKNKCIHNASIPFQPAPIDLPYPMQLSKNSKSQHLPQHRFQAYARRPTTISTNI